MNTWTDSGLSEAGLIGAMLAIGVEARLPDGPARSRRGGSRRSAEPPAQPAYGAARGAATRTNGPSAVPPPDVASQRSGRRRAAEPGVVPPAGDGGLGVPAADYADSHADSHADSFPSAGAAQSSGLTGSFPLTGAAHLYAPASVPLPSVPLPSEPLPPEPLPPQPSPADLLSSESLSSSSLPLEASSIESPSDSLPSESASSESASSESPSSESPSSESPSSKDDRDGLRSSTDGFLAGGFSSSSTDSPWDRGSVSSGMPSGLSGSWSQPVPITPQSPLDPAVSAPTTEVRESGLMPGLSPAVSAPTSLLPMPKVTGSHRAESTDSDDDEPADSSPPPIETFKVESETLGSLDSSDLFAALSRHRR